jgi:5S rRNA maturation endonuclease (ribonuclease M5)
MAIIRVRDFNVDVDIEKEIGEYTWYRARWMHDRLIACSPFRYDTSPSFYVYFQDTATAKAGSWGDSGGSEDYRKGTFVQLLAFLRSETIFECESYLLSEYAREYTEEDELIVDFSRLRIWEKRGALPKGELDQYEPPCDYLAGRGIAPEVEAEHDIKFDSKNNAVVIPWHFPDGRLANVKYRKTDSKIFFYHGEGYPLLELVFGLHLINRKGAKKAVLTEAEIDSMYVKSVTGIDAVAAGTSKLSDEKAEAIARSSIEEIIILADNDEAGEVLKEQAVEKLTRYNIRVKIGKLPHRYEDPNGDVIEVKDANDVKDANILNKSINEAETVGFSLFG